jgi:Mg-chelatase subunit ChlD
VYLAEQDTNMCWLIQVEDPKWEPDVPYAYVQRFSAKGSQWIALPADGTNMVHLASWVDTLELPFIGWRWATLAREIGYLHDKKVVLQDTEPLALSRLTFNRQGELFVSQGSRGADEYAFPAPDPPGLTSPASDVFALGASLKALASDNLPRGVMNVLAQATNPDPRRRYPNAGAFAEELAKALPNPARERKEPVRPKKSIGQLAALGALAACIGIVACVGLLIALGLLAFPLDAPKEAAVPDQRLLVTILDWNILNGCNGEVRVTVRDGDELINPNEGVTFVAVTPQATIREIQVSPGTSPEEAVLNFAMGPFCETGGALTIRAERQDRQGTNSVYYYPPDTDIPGNIAPFKTGGSQVLLRPVGNSRIYFSLLDDLGNAADLTGQIEIKVLQDDIIVKNPQLRIVNTETDPLVAVLVMDTSKSMVGHALLKAQDAAVNFTEKLDPRDYVCVYRFSTTVHEAHVCSTNKGAAVEAIRELTAGGNTSLYDALAEVGKRHANRADRQVIILLSDGADNNSRTGRVEGVQLIANTNVPVYAIGLMNQDLAPEVLQEIANRTGGEYVEAPSPDDLTAVYEGLRERFAKQYMIEFESPFPERNTGTLKVIISNGEKELSFTKFFQR